ncbi:MAG: hypothetical protein LBD15_03350 [Holosporales bacterium]|nr:hypothetical protein [Holosporales bacterium]
MLGKNQKKERKRILLPIENGEIKEGDGGFPLLKSLKTKKNFQRLYGDKRCVRIFDGSKKRANTMIQTIKVKDVEIRLVIVFSSSIRRASLF